MQQLFRFIAPLFLFPVFLFPGAGVASAQSSDGLSDYLPQHSGPLKKPSALLKEAQELEEAKKPEEAKSKFRAAKDASAELLKQLPRGYHDELYEIRGFSEEKLGDHRAALASYEKSLQLKSDNAPMLFRHAVLLAQMNRCDQASPEFQEVLWRSKESRHEPLLELARCALARGDKPQARKFAEEAQRVSPHFVPAHRMMVGFIEEQIAAAIEPAEQARLEAQLASSLALIVQHEPLDKASTMQLVRLLLTGGDPLLNSQRLKEAEEHATRLAKSSKFTDDESVRLLFDTQIRRGRVKAAEETLKTGLKKNPRSVLLQQAKQQLDMESQLDGES